MAGRGQGSDEYTKTRADELWRVWPPRPMRPLCDLCGVASFASARASRVLRVCLACAWPLLLGVSAWHVPGAWRVPGVSVKRIIVFGIICVCMCLACACHFCRMYHMCLAMCLACASHFCRMWLNAWSLLHVPDVCLVAGVCLATFVEFITFAWPCAWRVPGVFIQCI